MTISISKKFEWKAKKLGCILSAANLSESF